jgi:hypothetical protein
MIDTATLPKVASDNYWQELDLNKSVKDFWIQTDIPLALPESDEGGL